MPVRGRGGCAPRHRLRPGALACGLVGGDEAVLDVLEVLVEGAARHAGERHDVGDRDLRVALLRDGARDRVQHPRLLPFGGRLAVAALPRLRLERAEVDRVGARLPWSTASGYSAAGMKPFLTGTKVFTPPPRRVSAAPNSNGEDRMRRMWTFLAVGLVLCCAAPAGCRCAEPGDRRALEPGGRHLRRRRARGGQDSRRRELRPRSASSTTGATSRAPSPSGPTGASKGSSPACRSARTSSPRARRARRTRASRSRTTPTAARCSPARRSSPGSASRRPATRSATSPRRYQYRYKSTRAARSPTTTPTTRRPTSPTTTTDQGKTVPYIVRVETGYQDRDQYKIAVLYDPTKPWTAWEPAGAVEPQAPDHPRRELRDRAPVGLARRTSRTTRRCRAASR